LLSREGYNKTGLETVKRDTADGEETRKIVRIDRVWRYI